MFTQRGCAGAVCRILLVAIPAPGIWCAADPLGPNTINDEPHRDVPMAKKVLIGCISFILT